MDSYLTVRQIVERLPLSRSFVYDLIKSGTLPAYRIGGRLLVREADLEKALAPVVAGKAMAPAVKAARGRRAGKIHIEPW